MIFFIIFPILCLAVPTFTVACLTKELAARDTYLIEFEKPAGFQFVPGQYILFDVPHVDNPEDLQARAYSIACTPDEEHLLFAIKLTPGGRMSRFITERLSVGTTLTMKGPFGRFLLDEQTEKDYVFICTGTGNAPFRSQILSAFTRGDTRRMDLIYGVRSEEDLLWKESFESVAKEHPNFFFHIGLSAPSDSWSGHRGRVQTLVPGIVPDFGNKNVYICGNPDMTKEMKELCLNQWGVMKPDLHVEGFI